MPAVRRIEIDGDELGRWLDARHTPGQGEQLIAADHDGEFPRGEGFHYELSGMPHRAELLEHYESVSGLSTENIDYCLVLPNWKLGIVLEKTYVTGVRTGTVDPKITEIFGPLILELISTAADLVRSLTKRSS